MYIILSISIFIFGLIIGSFLNVIIFRLHTKEDIIKKPSYCTKCKKQIKWYDLIPVLSFIALRGKCRHCKKPISWQYPLVEFATGFLFVLAFWKLDPADCQLMIFPLFFISILIIVFVYDLKHMLIPDKVIFPAIAIAAIYAIINILNTKYKILDTIIAASIGSLFFYALYAISRGKWIGFGDVKLAIFMGLILGWPNILAGLLLGFLLGGIIGVILILIHRKKMKSQVSFGPFLVVGTLIAMFWGKEIIRWYLGMINY